MRVVLADVEQSALEQAEQELVAMGGTVKPVLTDVSKADQVEALARETVKTFGAVHLLFNNAGVGAGASIWETSLTDWEWVIGVNLWGVIHGVRAFVPIMLSQDTDCHIVNTASVAGLLPHNFCASYQVTKHAVVALSEQLYVTLVQQGAKIRASVLCPGFVRTRILSSSRNRPVEFQADASDQSLGAADEDGAWSNLDSFFTLMSPDQVADAVFTAIEEERFYIITHPEFNEMVRKRVEDMLEGRNPALQLPSTGDSPGKSAQPEGSPPIPLDIATVLKFTAAAFNPDHAKGLKAVYQFRITDGDEPSFYHLRIADGTCTYHEGRASDPSITIITPEDVWLGIARGEIDGTAAFMQGRCRFEGSLDLLMRIKTLFSGDTGVNKTLE
jgi:NAD(P)-dependent dehydrogenase (short-subunit alcohol dehydrogenase family)/putative sterol carrier protein